MVRGKKGQITYEYIIVLGMALLLVLPFFNYAFFTLGIHIGTGNGVAEAVQLVNAVEEVAGLGSGSLITVLMNDVESVVISNAASGSLITTILKKSQQQITLPSSVFVATPNPVETGSVSVVNAGGEVTVINTPQVTNVNPSNLHAPKSTVEITGNHLEGTTSVVVSGSDFFKSYTPLTVEKKRVIINISPGLTINDLTTLRLFAVTGSVYSNGFHVVSGFKKGGPGQ